MINYNIRILHSSNTALAQLISQGRLHRVNEQIEGVNGQVYALPAGIAVLNHFECQVADQLIHANLYALPPEEYAGLLHASPAFQQHQIAHLIPPLLNRMDSAAKDVWVRQLVTALSVKTGHDSTPYLLSQPVNPARWVPERTRLVYTSSGWFMSLFFESPAVQVGHGVQRSAAGIDVGLNTLAVTAFRSGHVHRAAGITDIGVPPELLHGLCGTETRLQGDVKRHVLLLQHAAARQEFQGVVQTLLSGASVVYVENLQYKEIGEAFKRRSRELGIRDFLMTWLPKRLTAQGIPWQRIKPDRTSQYCHLTHRRGERDSRDRTRFKNGNGDVVDADLNAALNIMQIGFAYRVERGL
ncbi:hypothetical protein DESA109040_12970 [Deinococcus saxicola]|uniref:zinc ribbon domain-containing protein n=1 Tax=Deinococcus saxicola TaxID=249406 RepID=UPI0039F09490